MTKQQIWLYGIGLFILVVGVGMIVSLTRIKAGVEIGEWTPIPVHTLGVTPTPTPGWWDEKPTPSISTKTPTPTTTKTTMPEEQE